MDVSGIALTAEYKHLDELAKMMIMKLKDIHQQLLKDGDEWISKRDEICWVSPCG